MRTSQESQARFERLEGRRARVTGSLDFSTARDLLQQGGAAVVDGEASVIDLSGVTCSDSAGLALLIEWLSLARNAGRDLTYENMPTQLHQLASLSEVEGLLIARN